MPPKKNLENTVPEPVVIEPIPDVSDDDETGDELELLEKPVEKSKRGRKPHPKVQCYAPRTKPNVKKERTQAQIDAWNRCSEARLAKKAERDAQRAEAKKEIEQIRKNTEMTAKKAVQDKLVRKAIEVKKKQIRQEKALEEISCSEDELDDVRQYIAQRRQAKKAQPVQPPPPIPQPRIQFY